MAILTTHFITDKASYIFVYQPKQIQPGRRNIEPSVFLTKLYAGSALALGPKSLDKNAPNRSGRSPLHRPQRKVVFTDQDNRPRNRWTALSLRIGPVDPL